MIEDYLSEKRRLAVEKGRRIYPEVEFKVILRLIDGKYEPLYETKHEVYDENRS